MANPNQPSDLNVAQWMAQELQTQGELYQQDAVDAIERRFGSDFLYENEKGNQAISRKVLAEFRRLTLDIAVWDRRERYWRLREAGETGRLAE